MHNHVILTGRLTHTPELRQTPAGIFVCTFSLAVQKKYNKNRSEQEVDFIEIETWRGTAEFVSKYFDKGDMIDITGRLKTSRWKDEEDITHYKTSVLAESVDFAPTNNRKSAENNADSTAAVDLDDYEEATDNDMQF